MRARNWFLPFGVVSVEHFSLPFPFGLVCLLVDGKGFVIFCADFVFGLTRSYNWRKLPHFHIRMNCFYSDFVCWTFKRAGFRLRHLTWKNWRWAPSYPLLDHVRMTRAKGRYDREWPYISHHFHWNTTELFLFKVDQFVLACCSGILHLLHVDLCNLHWVPDVNRM